MDAPQGRFWPSPQQELLLRVALGDAEETRAAWWELRRSFDAEDVEPGTFALLPLVYRALARDEIADSRLERLKGIYRSTWVKNNLLVERTRESLDVLAACGVPTLLVGGIGAAVRFYGDIGLRPTSRLDLLVDDVGRARTALARVGWHGEAEWLTDADGRLCLLSAQLAPDLPAHAELSATAQTIDVRATPAPVLGATDELFVTCALGARATATRSIQWIVDAAFVVRGGDVEWDRFVQLALEWRQALRLADALTYLSRLPAVAIPPEATATLRAAPTNRRDRIAHAWIGGSVRGLGGFPRTVGEYLAATAGRPPAQVLASLPEFLRDAWRLDHQWQIPLAVGRRAYRVLRWRTPR